MKRKSKRKRPHPITDSHRFQGWDSRNFVTVPRPDWLPAPGEIAKMLRKEKITILIDGEVVGYFKAEAAKNKTSYQKMIREVLRHYYLRQHREAA